MNVMTNLHTTEIAGVTVVGTPADDVLAPEALAFVAELHRRFNPRREELLATRKTRQEDIENGTRPNFLSGTEDIRRGGWRVAPIPDALQDRRVEITGPTERKMMINALNSGARVFMADFEDALSPTWENIIAGQRNVYDAARRRIELTDERGREYRLNDTIATLVIRPRGWHLTEKHVLVDGQPIAASIFDFGLTFFRNARAFLERGSGPYFYLPKLESHHEARLWNDIFVSAQRSVGLPVGTIKATVLIETILAAFEMDEILYELREHAAGLNAGRWDYMFSVIKTFRNDPAFTLPDRAQITMTAPFMRAYTELLVQTCHRRGAHAMGGMAAFIPSRRDAEVNGVAMAKVSEDKERETGDGFDGTWVAHPDLVEIATSIFDNALGEEPHQKQRLREDVRVSAQQLLDTAIPGGQVTEMGLRNNVSVGLRYLEAWLRGLGAVAIDNLMEDAATAEISRSQIWQWAHYGVHTVEEQEITAEFVRRVADEELAKIRETVGTEAYDAGRWDDARSLFEEVALADDFADFLTLPAYERFM